MAVFQRVARSSGAVLASIVGSFVVYGAHLACGPSTGIARVVPSSPAGTSSATSVVASASESSAGPLAPTAVAVAGGACGCASGKTTAAFVVSGDDKMVLDPLDAQVSLEVIYARGPLGKRQIVLSGVVRAYRTDVSAERPTTFGIRVHLPDSGNLSGSAASPTASQVEAYVTTWGAGSVVAPRSYASVAKSSLTYTVTDSAVEIRGSLTLKDVAAGRSITLDKLSLKKVGTAILPERTGLFHAP